MKIQSDEEKYAYKMGKDCSLNGANTKNCHFSIFATRKNTTAWEQGKSAGEASKKMTQTTDKENKASD